MGRTAQKSVMEHLKILELYSGIGGMHFAVKESGLNASVVAAVDINEVANSVYMLNFPSTTLLQRNIMSLSSKELNTYCPDVIMMSPPCQPFTRVGLRKDIQDGRTDSFMHVLSILPNLPTVQYILLENVKGFETSEARNKLISTLDSLEFIHQEFLLSPHRIFVPNTRLRYYLIAKRKTRNFCFPVSCNLMTSLPLNNTSENIKESSCEALVAQLNKQLCDTYNVTYVNSNDKTFFIKNILENVPDESLYSLNSKVLAKYAQILDIVTPESTKSCCFTKAYGHYVEGTGSILCSLSEEVIHDAYKQCQELEKGSDEYVNVLKNLNMRYFTPREVARLMCFPDEFCFPESITVKQKYRLLGNSINVHVVAILFVLLTHEE